MNRSLKGWMLFGILSIASLASAQTTNTSLRGVVKDSSGAVVPAAAVVLTDNANGQVYRTVSNSPLTRIKNTHIANTVKSLRPIDS